MVKPFVKERKSFKTNQRNSKRLGLLLKKKKIMWKRKQDMLSKQS